MDKQISEILVLLEKCSGEQRKLIFQQLRKEFPIHPVEETLNTQAEIILSAISKSATGLTFRMLRGVIAESAFELNVLPTLKGWLDITPKGDLPYDYLLTNGEINVKIQVKLQRSVNFEPMFANQAYRRFSEKLFVVETQKTRGGIDSSTNESTRPYHFGEFDILAVSMQPYTGTWQSFMYTVDDWLIPHEKETKCMLKFQPVSPVSNEDWTDDFETCVKWLNQKTKKTIQS